MTKPTIMIPRATLKGEFSCNGFGMILFLRGKFTISSGILKAMNELLDQIKYSDIKKAFFVGVGGRGVSAIARILNTRGVECVGSDSEDSAYLKELRGEGIECLVGHKAEYVPDDIDLMVVTPAVTEDNPEWARARELGIPVLNYPESLGVLSREYKTIAITGAHGKTTTTIMTALGMMQGGLDPSCVLGAPVKEFRRPSQNNFTNLASSEYQSGASAHVRNPQRSDATSAVSRNRSNSISVPSETLSCAKDSETVSHDWNCRLGESDFCIIEACEYRRGFLNLKSEIVVITNVDWEHMDYFKTEADFVEAFRELVRAVPKNGLIVAFADDKWTPEVVKEATCAVITYGENQDADYVLKGNDLWADGRNLGEIKVGVPGKHNRLNAMAAFAVCRALGVDAGVLLRTFEAFQGTYRRFQYMGKSDSGALIYNDYAHHPNEVIATLDAAREKYPDKHIVMAIQPHQYNRTWQLLDQYAVAFKDADLVIVPSIYEARDTDEDKAAVSPASLAEAIEKGSSCQAMDGEGYENTARLINKLTDENSIVFCTGSGDVDKLAGLLV